MMETFLQRFNKAVLLIHGSFRTAKLAHDEDVRNAYDDISDALGLSYTAVALLVWALNNMDSKLVEMSSVASQIGYPEDSVSPSIDELERHHYMVKVEDLNDSLAVTATTKELLINHYCFYKLMKN